uniref:G_PROTEIN_RECEP_F2_3 domain-containing protein n=1 Tax=Steinernema glaseri TaxID=37863 RepID=A0A1I7Z5C5_9BILA
MGRYGNTVQVTKSTETLRYAWKPGSLVICPTLESSSVTGTDTTFCDNQYTKRSLTACKATTLEETNTLQLLLCCPISDFEVDIYLSERNTAMMLFMQSLDYKE